jgi:hypothetical protein
MHPGWGTPFHRSDAADTVLPKHECSLNMLWQVCTYQRERLVLREWLMLMLTPGDNARALSG